MDVHLSVHHTYELKHRESKACLKQTVSKANSKHWVGLVEQKQICRIRKIAILSKNKMHAYNPSVWEIRVRGLEIQDYPWLLTEFKASLEATMLFVSKNEVKISSTTLLL